MKRHTSKHKMMYFPPMCLVKYRRRILGSQMSKRKLREPREMRKLHPGTQVPLYSPPAPVLFSHSSHPHLNVWLKAVKSWPGKRDEKGMKEDRKKV